MISHKHKCIFVHIPKCGGSSIEQIIWPNHSDKVEENLWMGFRSRYRNKYQTGGLQHLLAYQIKQEVGDLVFEDYYKFTFVRNPYDKAVSQYVYMKKRQDLMEYIGMSPDDSFQRYLELINTREHVQWCPQWRFIYDANNNKIVDFIGKFENFDNDLKFILKQVFKDRGGEIAIPHVNGGSRGHYRDYYNSHSQKIVQKIYGADIDLFKYGFSS